MCFSDTQPHIYSKQSINRDQRSKFSVHTLFINTTILYKYNVISMCDTKMLENIFI